MLLSALCDLEQLTSGLLMFSLFENDCLNKNEKYSTHNMKRHNFIQFDYSNLWGKQSNALLKWKNNHTCVCLSGDRKIIRLVTGKANSSAATFNIYSKLESIDTRKTLAVIQLMIYSSLALDRLSLIVSLSRIGSLFSKAEAIFNPRPLLSHITRILQFYTMLCDYCDSID